MRATLLGLKSCTPILAMAVATATSRVLFRSVFRDKKQPRHLRRLIRACLSLLTFAWASASVWILLPDVSASRRLDMKDVVALQLGTDPSVQIRLRLFREEAPNAFRYIEKIVEGRDFHQCSLYRGEPVPPYWGSTEYPDRYFDGGRWGPPYA